MPRRAEADNINQPLRASVAQALVQTLLDYGLEPGGRVTVWDYRHRAGSRRPSGFSVLADSHLTNLVQARLLYPSSGASSPRVSGARWIRWDNA